MKFSKEKFLQKAPTGIKRQLAGQLEELDGKEVCFGGRFGRDGYVEQHIGKLEAYLYPVYKSWCV